jgi:peptide/nickel transport system substrate-binding protein
MRTLSLRGQAAALASMAVLAACTADPGRRETPPELDRGGAAGTFKNPELRPPAPVPEDAADGGTLTVLTAESPSTFDPTQAYFLDTTAILSGLVTRALTQYVYDPDTDDMVLAPDMATDLGRPNDDNTEWTFTLREGLRYEDGSEVTAEDVAYAIKRSFAIEELPDGPTYQRTFFLDGMQYRGPFRDGDDYAGVVVDGNDITIKMRRPFPDMDYYASFPAFTGIPQEADDPATYGRKPLATGPYRFEEYEPGNRLALVRNEEWDPATDPGRIQAVDRWEFRFGQDTTRLENVIAADNGDARATLTYDNVSAATYRLLQEDLDRLVTGTQPCTYMWYLDMTKIEDIRVRRALGYAYPYENAWRGLGEIVGVTRIPGTTILPPGTAGRQEFDVLGIGGRDTDPERARALLEEADAVGFEVRFLYATDDDARVAEKDAIVKGLEAAGFEPRPVVSTVDTLRTDRTDPDAPIDVRSQAWCSDWPSGGSWFPAQWSGDLVGLEGMPNPANFDVPEMDRRQAEILDTMTPEEAARAWGEFDRTLQEEYYPAVVTGYGGVAMIHGSDVGGMANDNVRGMPTYARMYLRN